MTLIFRLVGWLRKTTVQINYVGNSRLTLGGPEIGHSVHTLEFPLPIAHCPRVSIARDGFFQSWQRHLIFPELIKQRDVLVEIELREMNREIYFSLFIFF